MRDLKLIVLIKQVPDPKTPVKLREDGTLDRERVRAVINPYDLHALEAALQLKEKLDAHVTALSMGPPKAEDALREAIALGADDAVLISDRVLAGSDTLATSYALSQAIKKLGRYDLVLCGVETTDGNTGQVGPEVAERLGIPQITYVEHFELRNGYVKAKRLIEGGYAIIKAKIPTLLTITNTSYEPREATVGGVFRAVKSRVHIWSAKDVEIDPAKVGLKGSPTKMKKIERVAMRRARYLIKDGAPDEMVDVLLKKLEEDGVRLW